MASRSVTVLGGGVAGLASALLLARDGHRVTVVERDAVTVTDPLDAPRWDRRGIPHFMQPHAFIPRGRLEMRTHLPDVYDSLVAAGAHDADLRPKLPGAARAEDDQLQYLAVRRPLIEWALRKAAVDEPGIEIRGACRADGIRMDGGRVTGAVVDGARLDADLVVDAMGRRTPSTGWLAAAGVEAPEPARSDCGVVYYSRYYRQRPHFDLPDGPWALSPRGDLGYFAYSTFPGDNRTFAAVFAVPPGPVWRGLKEAAAFEAAVAQIPALRGWVDPEGVDPITEVLPMAGLHNSLRADATATVPGLVAVGDALGHTDPWLAHGLAFALAQAAALAAALRGTDDIADVGLGYHAAVLPEIRERFEFASAADEQRHRLWTGGEVDFAHRAGDYELFTLYAGGAAALADEDVFRLFIRRTGLLDSIAVLDRDPAMQQRIEDVFAQLMSAPRPAAGPNRDEMLSLVSAHG